MIRHFFLYVSQGKLHLALHEQGEDDVTAEEIIKAIDGLGVDEYNSEPIVEALRTGESITITISETLPKRVPGACWITVDADAGTATVNLYPPHGPGKPVSEWDLNDALTKAGCPDFFKLTDVIHKNLEAMKRSDKPAVFIAAERRDAQIKVEISEDRKSAYMSYTPPYGGESLSLESALAAIAEAGVVFGIDEDTVREIIAGDKTVGRLRIAHGTDPVKGVDASIEYLFDALHQNVGPRIRENDTADFRDLGLFENVDEGTPLVQKTPATPGQEGTDVSGKPVKPEPGADIALPKGTNTKPSDEDENVLVAEIAGAPRLAHGKVSVEEVLIVEDVDFNTGNIDFKGNVAVKGIVNTGFAITAGGDISCKDTVEAAELTAGGSIFLKRGIKGMGKAVIQAGENVNARFIERCRVTAGGSVIVDEALIHSNTSAVQAVEVTNSKGCIFGGYVSAGELIRASYIGSEMAINTKLEVGIAPHIRDQLAGLNKDLKKKESDFDRARKNLLILTQLRQRVELPEKREQLYQQLSGVTTQLKSEIEEISSTIASLEQDLQPTMEARIEASKILHPGVSVAIRDARRSFKDAVEKAILVNHDGQVIIAGQESE